MCSLPVVKYYLSSGFRLLRGLLPAEAVKRLRDVNKAKLSEYIHPDQALKCWGGNNDYTFHFVPEKTSKKHVTFSDKTDSFKVSPSDYLTFNSTGDEFRSELTLINSGDASSAFKIRTTGPEKFKVKPRLGVLAPNSRLDVCITVMPGFDTGSIVKERFLIMATQVDDQKPLEDAFKDSKTPSEFRLKCKLVLEPVSESPVMKALDNLQKRHLSISKSLDLLKIIQMVNLTLTIVTVTLVYFLYVAITNSS